MAITDLVKSWNLPDRTAERVQVTLRLNYNEYARLHALKEAYPTRSVNEIVGDILRNGLDEIVAALPRYTMSPEEAHAIAGSDFEYQELVGSQSGPGVTFDIAYRKILEEKSEVEVEAA